MRCFLIDGGRLSMDHWEGKMKRLGLVLSLACVVGFATQYPVDESIAELRAKADYLEANKQLLLANDCSVTVNSNTVKLDARALRSEAMVIAIGPAFPGNYLAYHQAPKPQILENVVAFTINKGGGGKGALIVTARIGATQSGAPALVVTTNEPRSIKEAEGMYIYEKSAVGLKIVDGKVAGSVSGKTAHGLPLNVTCK